MDGLTVNPDGKLIRQHRLSKGWTQEHLAKISSINERTVQRAENNETISHETAAQIASSLNLTLRQITTQEETNDHNASDHSADPNFVVLHRSKSARQIIEGLHTSEKHVIEYDVDITDENGEQLASLVEMLEALAPFQDPPFDDPLSNLASRIRFTAKVAAKMADLAAHNINVFYGTYVTIEKRPFWDMDEGYWATTISQRPEPLTVSIVILSEITDQKILRRVQEDFLTEDDIPF